MVLLLSQMSRCANDRARRRASLRSLLSARPGIGGIRRDRLVAAERAGNDGVVKVPAMAFATAACRPPPWATAVAGYGRRARRKLLRPRTRSAIRSQGFCGWGRGAPRALLDRARIIGDSRNVVNYKMRRKDLVDASMI